MAESQEHGKIFENNLKENIIYLKKNLINIKYTEKWDIPKVYIKFIKRNEKINISNCKSNTLISFIEKDEFNEIIFSDTIFLKENITEDLYIEELYKNLNIELIKKDNLNIKNYKSNNIISDIFLKKIKNKTNDCYIENISIKSIKFNANKKINKFSFASLKRFFEIEEDFYLIFIGYKQENNYKIIETSNLIKIKKETVKKIQNELKKEEVELLEEKLKSFKLGSHEAAKKWYKSIKKEYEEKTKLNINFKVDSKLQRRIQCSFSIEEIFNLENEKMIIKNNFNLNNIESSIRKRIKND